VSWKNALRLKACLSVLSCSRTRPATDGAGKLNEEAPLVFIVLLGYPKSY
jgi:hypothetical protein